MLEYSHFFVPCELSYKATHGRRIPDIREHVCHLCRSRDPRSPAPVPPVPAPASEPQPVAALEPAAALAPLEQTVEIGSAVCSILHACWQCKRVAELHSAVKQRTFPPHLSAALKAASTSGYYAIPKRRGPKAVAAALKATEAGRALEVGALFLDSETESEDPNEDEGIFPASQLNSSLLQYMSTATYNLSRK